MSKQIHDEEDRKAQVKFRVSESKRDALDELADDLGTSRAQLLRDAADDILDEHGDGQDEEGYVPERPDLAELYQACLRHANQKLILNLRVKGGMVAEDTRYSKNDLVGALRPLERRGYVRIQVGGVFGRNLDAEVAVRVKPECADPSKWKYRKEDDHPQGSQFRGEDGSQVVRS
ncbi:ribbon-helix-helix protein, CopG family [Halostella salina]|uniref:ribbon-helix-helix protein, CopG family n=1 Tax=Halostella salina TaxID=1547897 RepID=UPI0013CE4ED2|nr:ribbon-helix-helix protein, CopG family [Halostella salina]